MKTILFQGDSITDCGRNQNNGSLLDIGQSYPMICASELSYEKPLAYKFWNRGISGNRIVDLYARLKCDFWNLEPDVLSILIGVNDVWHDLFGNGVEPERFYNVYKLILTETLAKFPDLKIILMEPFVFPGSATNENWEFFRRRVDENAEIVKGLASEVGATFIPLQCRFDEATKLAPHEYWIGDGIHPTIAGHKLIANEWMKAFKALNI